VSAELHVDPLDFADQEKCGKFKICAFKCAVKVVRKHKK
jgi:hypothetical protein